LLNMDHKLFPQQHRIGLIAVELLEI
jgi:hypothetical protein